MSECREEFAGRGGMTPIEPRAQETFPYFEETFGGGGRAGREAAGVGVREVEVRVSGGFVGARWWLA